jgi:hypothetical protein
MNASATATPLKDTQRAGASFLDVLASTSNQPSQSSMTVATSFRMAMNAHSDDESAQGQPTGEAAMKDWARGNEDEEPQTAAAAAGQKLAVAQGSQSRTNLNSAARSTGRDDRTQMSSTALAAKIAATVVLPSVQPALLIVSAATPAAQPLAEQKTESGKTESNVDAVELPGTKPANQSATAAEPDARSEQKPVAQGGKATVAAPETESDATLQSADAPASGTTSGAGFTLLAGTSNQGAALSVAMLSSMGLMPGFGEATQPTDKTLQSNKIPDQSSGKTFDNEMAGSDPKGGSTQAPSTLADSSVHSVANNQTLQHAQTDVSQPAGVTPKAADAGATQIQTISSQGTSRDAAPPRSREDEGANSPRLNEQPPQAQGAEGAAASGINTARVIQNMSESEMRVGMHSAEFGDISIRTSVSQQQMLAQISVDHGDLGKAISAHIPAMQEKLGGETGLRALVEVTQSGMSFSGERGDPAPKDQRTPAAAASGENAPAAESDAQAIRTVSNTADGNRLDIRA